MEKKETDELQLLVVRLCESLTSRNIGTFIACLGISSAKTREVLARNDSPVVLYDALIDHGLIKPNDVDLLLQKVSNQQSLTLIKTKLEEYQSSLKKVVKPQAPPPKKDDSLAEMEEWIVLCGKLEGLMADRVDYLIFPLSPVLPSTAWKAFSPATKLTDALNQLKNTKGNAGLAYFKKVLVSKGEDVSVALIASSRFAKQFE